MSSKWTQIKLHILQNSLYISDVQIILTTID